MKRYTLFLLAASTLLATGYAHAYTTYDCGGGTDIKWSSNTKTIYAYRGSFPAGSAFETALNETMARLNDNAGNFSFSLVYTWTVPSKGNGRSEIWIDDISPPGVTYSWWNGSCNFTEKDVIMDSSITWSTSNTKTTQSSYGGSGRPFQTTLLHELGHSLGLGHEAGEYNIMGQDWNHVSTNGSLARAYFGEDADSGAVHLYGGDGRQDVGIVHWRRTGASGAYSLHSRTRLLDPVSNEELPYSTVGGERRYNVNRWQQVKVELTFENNGTAYQYEDVEYYVSTNDYISTIDTPLTTRNIGVSPDQVLTWTETVTVPGNLNCNADYWLGAVVDKNASLVEYHEWNNASYIPIRVNWNFSCLVIGPIVLDPTVQLPTTQLPTAQ